MTTGQPGPACQISAPFLPEAVVSGSSALPSVLFSCVFRSLLLPAAVAARVFSPQKPPPKPSVTDQITPIVPARCNLHYSYPERPMTLWLLTIAVTITVTIPATLRPMTLWLLTIAVGITVTIPVALWPQTI